jgi:hypothetical protein
MKKILLILSLLVLSFSAFAQGENNAVKSGVLFDKKVFDFGDVLRENKNYTCTFIVENQIDKPLVLLSVKTSCSCLKAEVVDKVVKAGSEGEIKLTYNPKGHMGAFEQRVYIYTNLSQSVPTAVLYVVGRVVASASHASEYPYHRGMLRLRQDNLQVEAGREQTMRVACYNAGTRAMRLREDTLLSSRGVTMRSEPEVLAGGAEGDLIITYSPTKGVKEQSLRLYIMGLTLPPRERMILLNVVK